MPRTFLRPETTPAALAADPAAGRGRPFVSLTTDFGARDPSTAICLGVVHAIAPAATVMTVTAEIAKFKIRDGALTLWATLPYLPVGAHVAVVDPGVGTERHPLAVATARGDILVGPDNGLLIPAAERLGGITAVHRLEAREYQLSDISTSFHGRDIFAPAAAHLVNGVPIEAFGPAVVPEALERLAWPEVRVGDGALETAIVYVDSFGNIKLVGEVADLRPPSARCRRRAPPALGGRGRHQGGGRALGRDLRAGATGCAAGLRGCLCAGLPGRQPGLGRRGARAARGPRTDHQSRLTTDQWPSSA
jgi:S-adenosylmethionine hydrolase